MEEKKQFSLSELSGIFREWFLRNILLPIGDRVTGQYVMERLKFLERAQWWDPERLHIYRDNLLSSLIDISYREVPFYHQRMDDVRIKPSDIRSFEDLQKLPIVTKDDLRKDFPDKVTRKTGQKTYLACTSGSTGKNFCVVEDAQTAGWYRATFMLELEWAGWRIGEPHLQTGMTLNRSIDRWLKDLFLNCHYISAYDLSDARLDANLNLMEKYGIKHLWGYSGSLFLLAKRAQQVGWNQALKTVISWGDMLYPHYRRTIEDAFQIRVIDTYGCSEGMQIASQCKEHQTYHVHTLDVCVEFLDDKGEPVLNGEPGNIIVTRLHPGPMPLIRYRIGDIGTPISGNCLCGRGFDSMGGIQGRDTDIIITPSGNRLIVHFFTGVLEHFPEIDSFQVLQDKTESLLIRIVPCQELNQEKIGEIIKALKSRGAEDLQIEIELVESIPLLPSGKRRFVINPLAKRST